MYQLNYRSQARNGLEIKDLDAILSTAIIKNAALEISGCLIYHNGYFVQILEGKKELVQSIFNNIERDNRHHNIVLLGESEVEKRTFPDWNMAYHEPKDKNVRQFVHNLLTLSELSAKSSDTLRNFWWEVRKVLLGG